MSASGFDQSRPSFARSSDYQRYLPWIVATSVLLFVLATIHSSLFPPAFDADLYWAIAAQYRDHGILHAHQYSDLRTYLYPLFVSLVLSISDAFSSSVAYLLAFVQYLFYLLSCAVLANAIGGRDERRATVVFALLACNVFAIPYTALPLTDSLSLAFFQLFIAALVKATASQSRVPARVWIGCAGLFSTAAMEVRPAYIWLPVLGFLVVLVADSDWSLRRLRKRATDALVFMVFAIMPMLPQMAINKQLYGRASPLPTADLQGMQLQWGKENLKYATNRYQTLPPQVFYRNPFYVPEGPSGQDSADWYLQNPADAIATIAAKAVGSFDFDYVEPYIYHPRPPLQTPVRIFSLSILFLGFVGILGQALGLVERAATVGPRLLPLAVLIGWSSVTLLSAVELRFSLPMLAILLLSTAATVVAASRMGRRRTVIAAIAFIAGTYALFTIAEFGRQGLTMLR